MVLVVTKNQESEEASIYFADGRGSTLAVSSPINVAIPSGLTLSLKVVFLTLQRHGKRAKLAPRGYMFEMRSEDVSKEGKRKKKIPQHFKLVFLSQHLIRGAPGEEAVP